MLHSSYRLLVSMQLCLVLSRLFYIKFTCSLFTFLYVVFLKCLVTCSSVVAKPNIGICIGPEIGLIQMFAFEYKFD